MSLRGRPRERENVPRTIFNITLTRFRYAIFITTYPGALNSTTAVREMTRPPVLLPAADAAISLAASRLRRLNDPTLSTAWELKWNTDTPAWRRAKGFAVAMVTHAVHTHPIWSIEPSREILRDRSPRPIRRRFVA